MVGNKFARMLLCIVLLTLTAAGCSDDSDDFVSPTPVDTAPPAVPNNVDVLHVDGTDGYVRVTWSSNTTDADFAGVMISRTNDGEVEWLTDGLVTTVAYQDFSCPRGRTVYSVYAVDQTGNQSAAATAEMVIADTHPPREISL